MSEIKNSIKSAVIPEANSLIGENAIGIVYESNERENTCSVSYRNDTGIMVRKSDVPLRISNADSWFPKAGEPVHLSIEHGDPVIVAQVIGDYSGQVKKFSCGQNNVSMKSSTTGGSII